MKPGHVVLPAWDAYLGLMHVAAVSAHVSRTVVMIRESDVRPHIVHQLRQRQRCHDATFMTFDPHIGVPKIGGQGGSVGGGGAGPGG